MCGSSGSFSVCMVCHLSLSFSLTLLHMLCRPTHNLSDFILPQKTHLTSFLHIIANANGITAALKLKTDRRLSPPSLLLDHVLVNSLQSSALGILGVSSKRTGISGSVRERTKNSWSVRRENLESLKCPDRELGFLGVSGERTGNSATASRRSTFGSVWKE